MTRLYLTTLLLLAAAPAARADWQEGTFSLAAGPSLLSLSPSEGNGGSATVTAPRLALRVGYGVSNTFTVGLELGGDLANAVQYAEQTTPEGNGTIHQDYRDVAALAQVTARLGVTWIPTLTAGLGYQHRWTANSALLNATGSAFAVLPDESVDELVGAAGVGLDYRLSPHWIVGASVELRHALVTSGSSWNDVEIPVHISYVFYPGFGSGTGYLPGGEPLRPGQ